MGFTTHTTTVRLDRRPHTYLTRSLTPTRPSLLHVPREEAGPSSLARAARGTRGVGLTMARRLLDLLLYLRAGMAALAQLGSFGRDSSARLKSERSPDRRRFEPPPDLGVHGGSRASPPWAMVRAEVR